MRRVFAAVGLEPWFRYQKYREEFSAPGVTIAVDETPVGTFVELEGTEAGILATAAALGRIPERLRRGLLPHALPAARARGAGPDGARHGVSAS